MTDEDRKQTCRHYLARQSVPGHEIESGKTICCGTVALDDREDTIPNTSYLYLSLGRNHPEMMYRYIFSRSKPYHGNIKSTPYRDPAKYPDKSELYHCTA
jgi:hypothetical protein